ncbi:MAG: DUF2064 domain-containing protein [Nitrospinota bacterium]
MNKLLIFAKSPIKGKVKTRLKKDTPLTDGNILKLYTAFLKDTIISASLSNAQKVYIAYYPEDSREVMIDIIKGVKGSRGRGIKGFFTQTLKSIELFPQSGNDFDTRLTNALKNIHNKSSDNIIILGSDSPHIQPSTINRAFRFLKYPLTSILSPLGRGGSRGQSPLPFGERVRVRGAMVLGPSGEGGIYLIGLKFVIRNPQSAISFRGVFTTGNESDNLLKIARSKKLALFILEELTDVDVKSDLITLISNLYIMKYSSKYARIYLPKHTIKVIKKLGLGIGRKGNKTREKHLTIGKIYAG